VLIKQGLFIGVPDPTPKHKKKKMKLHNTSNRLETGPKTIKDYNLPKKKRNDGLPEKLPKLSRRKLLNKDRLLGKRGK
jgi:hypothetical protein